MPDHREIIITMCFPEHLHDFVSWLWHLWCRSPKERAEIQESATHSARLNSVSQSVWAMPANKIWGKLRRSCQPAGSLSSGSVCPEGLTVDSLIVNPGPSVAIVSNLQCCFLSQPLLGVYERVIFLQDPTTTITMLQLCDSETNFAIQLQSHNKACCLSTPARLNPKLMFLDDPDKSEWNTTTAISVSMQPHFSFLSYLLQLLPSPLQSSFFCSAPPLVLTPTPSLATTPKLRGGLQIDRQTDGETRIGRGCLGAYCLTDAYCLFTHCHSSFVLNL